MAVLLSATVVVTQGCRDVAEQKLSILINQLSWVSFQVIYSLLS